MDTQMTESVEPLPLSVPKKSRLDDDNETTTIPDDGQIWSKSLADTRETTRLKTFIFVFL